MDIASGTVPPVVNDATANKNNMVSNGMTYANQAGGLIGNALTFDGLTQYLAVPSPASLLQFTTSMTVSAWVNAAVSQINGYCDIIGRRYGTEWYDSWLLTIHSGKPCFVIGMDENLNYPYNRIYGGLIETNQWIHLAGVKNNRSYDLYVNGQLTASGISSSASLAVDANDVSIGAEQNYAYSEFFNGIIDEVEASNVDRPASWIKLSYETQKPGSRVVTVK